MNDSSLTSAEEEIIRNLRQQIIGGKHWYLALLEAMKLWTKPDETINGRAYHYLIEGEAFDWLLLAERLCQSVADLIPEEEKSSLLFKSRPPLTLTKEKFRELLGELKYQQYLNYYYGITVEEALVQAVEEEVRKERLSLGLLREADTTNEAYRRIYGTTRAVLLKHFRKEKGYPQLRSISLTELKEFTYWLFKYRVKHCDSTRVASDTKKALTWLKNNGFSGKPMPV
ncbi:MAG: hypothetical protein V1767_07290 [Chloroflexota bacterium]